MAGQGGDHEASGFGRSITFTTRRAAAAPAAGDGPETLMTRVFGSKNAPNQRVSESLDYEPVQNKIFYERMRQAKKERHLFG
jgi:chloride channel 7